jgi:hypothetical protein
MPMHTMPSCESGRAWRVVGLNLVLAHLLDGTKESNSAEPAHPGLAKGADTKTDTNEEWRRSFEEWQSFLQMPASLGLNCSYSAA